MGILVADRKFFGEIGSLDGGMKIYGGENVELGIRVKFSHGFKATKQCFNTQSKTQAPGFKVLVLSVEL